MRGRVGVMAALALLLVPQMARADEPDLLAVGVGAYNFLRHNKEAQLRLEYRFSDRLLYILRPIVGALATNKGTFYGYGGFRIDAAIGQHVVITPEAAAGYWYKGGGKDLGGPFEFKTGAEFAYRFTNNARFGLLFDHISNAGIYKKNPGVESLLLVYSIPLGW